jgi:hypothetical protein
MISLFDFRGIPVAAQGPTHPGNAEPGIFPPSDALLFMMAWIRVLLKFTFFALATGCSIGPQIKGGMKFVIWKDGFSSSTNFQIACSPSFLPTQ